MEKVKDIVSLVIQHEYYTDGKCGDLGIDPLPSAERILAGEHVVFLPHENGFKLCCFPGEMQQGFSAAALPDLFFCVTLKKPEFLNYTALTEKKGYVNYFTSEGGKPVENRLIKLEGKLFNYFPDNPGDYKALKLVIKNSRNETVYQEEGKTETDRISFQPDLRVYNSGLYTLFLYKGSKQIEQQDIYIDDDLKAKNGFGILHLRSVKLSGASNLNIDFKSIRESWKFYFISEKDNDDTLVLKDSGAQVNENRYSGITFNFCERPVELTVQGARTYFFETGALDKNEVFEPQLIPSYEENKAGLNLSRYELSSGSGRSQSHNEQYFFCIDKKYWSKKDKKHIVPKGQKAWTKVKLGAKVSTVLSELPGPSLKKTNKEIFIYI